MKAPKLLAVVWGLLSFLLAVPAMSCGLSWEVPKQHFDGVQEQGRLSYHGQEWGRLRTADGTELPLIVNFDSGREWSSPVLGQGWMFMLTDSYIVKNEDGNYKVVMPDGYHYGFGPKMGQPGMFQGHRGWLAQVEKNSFKAWAPCGWSIEWRNGKIAAMSTKGGSKIVFERQGEHVTAIRENGVTLLRLQRDPSSGKVSALQFGDQQIALTHGQRPMVQTIKGKNVIGSMADALASATWTKSGSAEPVLQKDYTFAVDDRLTPSLEITANGDQERFFQWNPVSRTVLKDTNWTYAITPPPAERSWQHAAIRRTNAKGQSEFWHFQGWNGKETIQTLDGTKTVKEWFIRGPLRNKIRSIQTEDKKGAAIRNANFYNADGEISKMLHGNWELSRFDASTIIRNVKEQKSMKFQLLNDKLIEITVNTVNQGYYEIAKENGSVKIKEKGINK